MHKIHEGAPRALFLHGAGGGGWQWNIWRRAFEAQGWRTHAPDLHPVGAGIAATRLADYAAQATAHLRETSATLLVGASLGGLLALMAASRVEVAALVLINPLPAAGVAPPLAEREYAGVVGWSRCSLGSTQRAMPDADDAARLYALRRWRDESGAALREACAGVPLAWPRSRILVLASERDEDVPAQTSRALAEVCAAQFHLLRGASHVGPLLGGTAHGAAEIALRWVARALRADAQGALERARRRAAGSYKIRRS